MRIGLFLFFFGLLIFSTRLLLSKRTRAELRQLNSTVPSYFRSNNKALARMIVILILLMIVVYILMELS
ncbi:MAG: hypothetical protein COA98_05010 [Candidatus Neomarinimicrobiota bacterium]|nr:MAG: hypothetical protein COA98_05010 [Candidatus Neomarinimicrobiota bacterium]